MTKVLYSKLSPIVLFVYRRLCTTRLVVNSLLTNAEAVDSDLIIFSDAPKSDSDAPHVQQVRDYLNEITGFKSLKIINRPFNMGLANSFIDGISSVLNAHDSAIFLEDDNIVSPFFLNYMNNGLAKYEHNEFVSCISGYSPPFPFTLSSPYFLRGAETWSLATWRRAWADFEPDPNKLMNDIVSRRLVNSINSYGNQLQFLRDFIDGKNDSWGIRWWLSAFLCNRVTLYPHKPLVVIADPGIHGTHNVSRNSYFRSEKEFPSHPITIYPNKAIESYSAKILHSLMNFLFKVRSVFSRVASRFSSPFLS